MPNFIPPHLNQHKMSQLTLHYDVKPFLPIILFSEDKIERKLEQKYAKYTENNRSLLTENMRSLCVMLQYRLLEHRGNDIHLQNFIPAQMEN